MTLDLFRIDAATIFDWALTTAPSSARVDDVVSAGWIATATRPRGGEWLEDDVRALVRDGVHVLVSMLTHAENVELGLTDESVVAKRAGLAFLAVPIADREVPERAQQLVEAVAAASSAVAGGKRVVVHCRMGVGRSSMFAAATWIRLGADADETWAAIASARGRPVPDVAAQRTWVDERVSLLRAR